MHTYYYNMCMFIYLMPQYKPGRNEKEWSRLLYVCAMSSTSLSVGWMVLVTRIMGLYAHPSAWQVGDKATSVPTLCRIWMPDWLCGIHGVGWWRNTKNTTMMTKSYARTIYVGPFKFWPTRRRLMSKILPTNGHHSINFPWYMSTKSDRKQPNSVTMFHRFYVLISQRYSSALADYGRLLVRHRHCPPL